MNIFKDESLDKMNWLEMVCEPVEDPLNDILQAFPDETVVTYDDISGSCSYSVSSMSVGDILRRLSWGGVGQIGRQYSSLSYEEQRLIHDCFSFVVEGEQEIIVDFYTRTLTGGTLKMVKIKHFFEEKESLGRIGKKSQEELSSLVHEHANINKENINEILDLLGLEEAVKNRSVRQKAEALRDKMNEILKTNEWNIRNIPLSNRVGKWLKEYVTNGNLAALANFCKMKAMTHDDAPIYSIEGEEKL